MMRNTTRLALLCGALALILFATRANCQTPSPTPSPQKANAPAVAPPPASPSPTPVPTEAADDEEGEVIRVSSNLVVVPVSVTDEKGQPVMGLTVKDFRLQEEGRVQEIAQIGDPEQVPLDIAILLDVSSSVDARFAFEQEAAARFLKQVLKPVDTATVFAIDATSRLEQTRATAEVASAKLLTIGPAKGFTAFYDTVVDAARYLVKSAPAQHRRVIVVISDGADMYSERFKTLVAALTEVQKAEAVFYSINPSGQTMHLNVMTRRGQQGMEQIAQATGGNSFVPQKLEDLNAVFNQIAAELRSQYLLQYYSSDESSNGKFLRIKVSTPTRPQLRVRARQGYYAKRK
ncbi:MAG TPA: VWA domain-containing protein [Pyrinomonadaceae bacterium]